MLAVFGAQSWWQSRYIGTREKVIYGWPVPFDHLWYSRSEWDPGMLALNVFVWLILIGSVGYVVETWWRKPNALQFTIRGLLALQAAVAVVLALACTERYFRAHPNNGSDFPKLARWVAGDWELWLDLGLFTDPPANWLLVRVTIILAIGCAGYTAVCLPVDVLQAVRRVMAGEPAWPPAPKIPVAVGSPEIPKWWPVIGFGQFWFLVVCIILGVIWLLLPAVY